METESNKKQYMREYMKMRYQNDPLKATQYRNSCRIKAKLNISDEEFSKYGVYLADFMKIKELLSRIPPEMAKELIDNI